MRATEGVTLVGDIFLWSCLAAILGLGGGAAICFILVRRQDRRNLDSATKRKDDILAQAVKEAENLRKEAELKAKDEAFKWRDQSNRDLDKTKSELRDQERRLEKRENSLEQQNEAQLKKERQLQQNEAKLQERKELLELKIKEMDELKLLQAEKLHEISHLNRTEAEKMLLERLDKELADEIGSRIQKHEEQVRANSEARAREILATAIQRYAAEHTADTTVSTVDIPSDDMKGRIIGREGRNIRTFEKATGVDVIVDDTPGVVIVSAFDNVRRETAKLALTKLIQDGRIHPSRIEEVVKETQEEMEKHILEAGQASGAWKRTSAQCTKS